MRILFITTDAHGINFYRIWQPANQLVKRGYDVDYTMEMDTYSFFASCGYKKPVEIGNWDSQYNWIDRNIKNYDLIVSTKAANPQVLSLLLAIREGYKKPFVMDFDDNFSCVPKYNVVYAQNQPSGDFAKFSYSHLMNANAAHTPSQFLCERYKKFNENMYYTPNMVDPEIWDYPQRQRKDKKIKIVIAAATGRWGDVVSIKDVLSWVLKKYDNVQLIFMGCIPDFAMKYPKNRTFVVQWAVIPFYMRLLRWMNCDIGLSPMLANDFNRSKSNLKYLDYGMVRAAGIYQDLDPYKCVKHGETGMLVKDKQGWKDCLRALIEDASLREKIKENAYQDVMDNWTPDKVIPLYEKAYEEVLNGNSRKQLYIGSPKGLQRPSSDSRQDCRG